MLEKKQKTTAEDRGVSPVGGKAAEPKERIWWWWWWWWWWCAV